MQKILILDYGSQYTQLIARRVRELKVYSEVVSPLHPVNLDGVSGIILSGGPSSVYGQNAPELPMWFFQVTERKIPVLGICYGFQLLVQYFGGRVFSSKTKEYGKTHFLAQGESSLFSGIPKEFDVWMSHGDSVMELSSYFNLVGRSESGVLTAIENADQHVYGIQFHPEVMHTQYGNQIIENFLYRICSVTDLWELQEFATNTIKQLQQKIGKDKVISGFSGGIDSSVASLLVHRAVGKQLTNVFVDTGMMRKDESQEVSKVFRDSLRMEMRIVDAKWDFFRRLKGITDPEEKRRSIGETFIRVFEKEAIALGNIRYLVQGTIYSDVIESASTGIGNTSKIKSHHNVGALPEKMDLALIEPIRYLFKDEVRKVGEILEIPHHTLHRHPFPGPGLAVRCLGEVTEKKVSLLQEADAIFLQTLREQNWYYRTWQAFAVLLDSRTVGVTGDERSYGYTLALRAVDSIEGMTADWTRLPHEVLDLAARRITNQIPDIGRVVFDITSKPPATIEWE